MPISDTHLTVALISDVFETPALYGRLHDRLQEAQSLGADLAVLPELPLNPWSPATRMPRDDDAEPPGGPRQVAQASAAADVGIHLVGGAIITDPATGVGRNTAIVFDNAGDVLGTYAKCHLPHEPGFWERSHYEPGEVGAVPIAIGPWKIGIQICSDMNRPQGTHLLAASGADVVICPRSTERITWPRWRPVFIAAAVTSRCYTCSVNRPAPEHGVLIGGPSIAVAPDTTVLAESTQPVSIFTAQRAPLTKARTDYPGYLPVRADLYASGWADVATTTPSI